METTLKNNGSNQPILLEYQKRIEKSEARRQFVVKGIWLYFILLIFEGALRKWVLPSLATPLLIVRDPVAIGLLLYAWYYDFFPKSIFIVWITIITLVSAVASLFIGHGNIFVTLYGARILLIHFPFIFLVGSILNKNDVIRIGKALLWISIPMAVLIVLQFYSPQSAWVNTGVGGDMDSGFGGAMGYFRPPGTFSFNNGTSAFFRMAAAFIFYFWLRPGNIRKVVLIAATVGLILAIPFSISRALTFSVAVMIVFVLLTLSRNPKYLGKILGGIIGISILVILLMQTGFLDTPMEVFLNRFEQAAKSEGGVEGTLGERYLGGMYNAIVGSGNEPFFGKGLGMGTNAGSVMLGAGERTFLISEGEWGRLVGEMGALLGISVIAIRLIISVKLTLASYFKIPDGEVLPWMLLSYVLLIFPQGAWAQPTTLGFSTLVTGLLIASFNEAPEPKLDSTGITEESDKKPTRA